jgi:hypothetical protein
MPPETAKRRLRHRRKRRSNRNRRVHPKDNRCYDWSISTASSHHACRDRSSFTSYTPFPCESYLGHSYFADVPRKPVLGVGTVVLRLLRSPESSNSEELNINTVTLENVLHCPSIVSNVFSMNVEGERRDLRQRFRESGIYITDADGRSWGFAERSEGRKLLRRADGRQGGSSFKKDTVYSMSFTWPESEERRVLGLIEEEREQKYRRKLSKRPDALTGGQG